LLLAGAGCSKTDKERLERVARKVTEKAALLSAATNDRLQTGFQGFPANLDLANLGMRVSDRIHWDKELADLTLQVEANGGVVTLRGVVANLAQRQRAVGLADSTIGVVRVVDELQIPTSSQ
jgi:osmotically-inducible protein OsmY